MWNELGGERGCSQVAEVCDPPTTVRCLVLVQAVVRSTNFTCPRFYITHTLYTELVHTAEWRAAFHGRSHAHARVRAARGAYILPSYLHRTQRALRTNKSCSSSIRSSNSSRSWYTFPLLGTRTHTHAHLQGWCSFEGTGVLIAHVRAAVVRVCA
jgi:hypothetical protein